LFAGSVRLWRDFDLLNVFRIYLNEVLRLAVTFELACCCEWLGLSLKRLKARLNWFGLAVKFWRSKAWMHASQTMILCGNKCKLD
jgi:hypothetical protein